MTREEILQSFLTDELFAENGYLTPQDAMKFKWATTLGIPLNLIRRSAATWKCVPPVFDHGVPGGLTRYSGAN